MKKFSINRFCNVLRANICEMKNAYIGYAILTVVLIILTDLIQVFMFQLPIPQEFLRPIKYFAIISVMGTVVFPASMMNFTKNTKISFLLQPAAVNEKYIARFLVYWVIPTVFAFGMFWLLPHTYQADESVSPYVNVWREYRITFLLYLCVSGIMILGGTFFGEKAAIKTLGTLALLIILFVLMCITFENSIKSISAPQWFQNMCHYISEENYRISLFQLTLGFSIVAACIAISYRRFKRLTIK